MVGLVAVSLALCGMVASARRRARSWRQASVTTHRALHALDRAHHVDAAGGDRPPARAGLLHERETVEPEQRSLKGGT